MFELLLLSIFVTNTVPTETVEKHLNNEAIAVVGLILGVGLIIWFKCQKPNVDPDISDAISDAAAAGKSSARQSFEQWDLEPIQEIRELMKFAGPDFRQLDVYKYKLMYNRDIFIQISPEHYRKLPCSVGPDINFGAMDAQRPMLNPILENYPSEFVAFIETNSTLAVNAELLAAVSQISGV